MPRFSYVNGEYVPHSHAGVHIEDRGFQFSDGVYEVIACIHGNLADERGHLDRLERSLGELSLVMPLPRETLRFVIRELLRRNRLQNAIIYLQVTRGVARRDFPFPPDTTPQSLVVTTWPFAFERQAEKMETGARAIIVSDQRWKRRDIKTTLLLPSVLAKQQAVEQGASEAWLLDENGFITEGYASNAWIVTKGGVLVTRTANHDILRGVTRTALDKLRQDLQIPFEERAFTPQEVYEAQEAFNTSATALLTPIVEIDGHKIGTGQVGPVTKRLYEEYMAYIDGLRGEPFGWSE